LKQEWFGRVLALLITSPAWSHAATEEPVAPQPPPLYEAPARSDRIGRILVPVTVNGQGPFQFVLDTGANRTVLTPALATLLGLDISANRKVTLSGVTGSASVPTVSVDEVRAGNVALNHQILPIADSLSPNVHGILGVDALEDARIQMDFSSGKLAIRKAHRQGVLDGMTRIPGECRHQRLLIVRADVGRVAVSAVIDTGSQYTLGNRALRVKLGLPERVTDQHVTEVIGETLARQPGERRVVPVLRMGSLQQVNPQVVFGDFHVFKLWHLEDRPAIVVGMDLLGSLESMLIDYQRCEIQVRARNQD
jgi:predicted aspartyl protease